MDINQLRECLESGAKVRYIGSILKFYKDRHLEIVCINSDSTIGITIALVKDIETHNSVWVRALDLALF